MAANTNVPIAERTEGIPIHAVDWTNETALDATALGSPVALFYCELPLAIDHVHFGYSTASTSASAVKLSYASSLAGTRTDILTGLNTGDGSTKEKNATISGHAPLVPAGNWLFVERDTGTLTGLDGLRIYVRGRRNVRS